MGQRRKEMREAIAPFFDELLRLYEFSEPESKEEFDRLETARVVIDYAWFIFTQLAGWAEFHVTGLVAAEWHPEDLSLIAEELGFEQSADSPFLEYVGAILHNSPYANVQDPMYQKIKAAMEQKDLLYVPNAMMRDMIIESLTSDPHSTPLWRKELLQSLSGLNDGFVSQLLRPSKLKTTGNVNAIKHWKLLAIEHVSAMVGHGYKKYKALEIVGDAIGQSIETLRSWEKEISKTHDGQMELLVALRTGELRARLPSLTDEDYEAEFGIGLHRGLSGLENVRRKAKVLDETSLASIRDGLRRARADSEGMLDARWRTKNVVPEARI